MNAAAPNSAAPANASTTYSTRRSGSASAGTERSLIAHEKTVNNTMPSISAPWMIRARIDGEMAILSAIGQRPATR